MSKAAAKVKLLSGISLWLANQGGDLAEKKIKEALKDDSPEERLADIFFRIVDDVVEKISNDNPDNAGEVKKALFDGIKDRIRPFLVDLTQPILEDIKSIDDRAVADYIRDMLYDIVGIYTDQESENKKQFKDLFTALRKSERTKEVVLDNLILNRLFARWKGTPREDYYLFLKSLLDELWVLVAEDNEESEGALIAVAGIEAKLKALMG